MLQGRGTGKVYFPVRALRRAFARASRHKEPQARERDDVSIAARSPVDRQCFVQPLPARDSAALLQLIDLARRDRGRVC